MTTSDLAALDAWAAIPLPWDPWPAGLAAVLGLVRSGSVPMAVVLGDEQVLVYNDAYAAVLAAKHPAAFGRPAREVFPENWDLPGHGDVVERVYRTGEPFADPDTVLPAQRGGPSGPVELVHFSRSYTPVRADDGRILGVLSVILETTGVNRALTGVADLTTRLAAAVSVDHVAREALQFAVGAAGADHARLVLAEGPVLRMARRAKAVDDESVDRLPPLWNRVAPDAKLPSAQVITTGEPLWLEPDELVAYPDLAHEPLWARDLQRIATLPLLAGGVRGALSLAWESATPSTQPERSALLAAANLVATSLARAQQFDEQRGLADTLQLRMLPALLPQPSGIGLAARYVPSQAGATAGGDFYDAFDAGAAGLCLVIGDVAGHGAQAATVMGQVRAAVRVLAAGTADPAGVLDGLDAFVASLGEEAFVTLVVGFLDDRRHLRLACAGHPAPVLCRRDGDNGFAGTAIPVQAGPPVGIPGSRPVLELDLRRDDVLVLYTDGLVEVPGDDPDAVTARLVEQAARVAGTADPRRICGTLLEQRRATGDDAALMVLAVHERRHAVASTELPAEATSPGQARRWARTTLTGWQCEEPVVDDALVGLSELVTNVVLHARSAARVELDLDDERLLVLVTDHGGAHAAPARQDVDGESGRGRGLSVVEAISAAWGHEQTSRGTTVWFEILRPSA